MLANRAEADDGAILPEAGGSARVVALATARRVLEGRIARAADDPASAATFDPVRALGGAGEGLRELVVPSTADAGAEAAVAGLARSTTKGIVLRVRDALSERETGRLHARGLAQAGCDPSRVVTVCARNAREALWAMELGLGCPSVGGVVGEIYGNPSVLGFTATRRLALMSERTNTPCLLLRLLSNARSSGARRRWSLASLPSTPDPHDDGAPGAPRWRLDLLRARDRAPGSWIVARNAEGGMEHVPSRDGTELRPYPGARMDPEVRARA